MIFADLAEENDVSQPKMSVRLSKRTVDAASGAAEKYRLWDADLKGFGLRVTPAGIKTYFVYYRVAGGRTGQQREFTLGRHGKLTPELARMEAERLLASVQLGADPQGARSIERAEMTVSELSDLYLKIGVGTKKASTLRSDISRIESHIKPLLGRKKITKVTPIDVEQFLRDIGDGKSAAELKPSAKTIRAAGKRPSEVEARRGLHDKMAKGGKGTATRTVGLLGGIFTFAIREKLLKENPVTGVQRYKDKQSQRFLSLEDLGKLATALDSCSVAGTNLKAISIIKLLVLSAGRKSEIENLKWSEVDLAAGCLRLEDSKTGARIIHLGEAALDHVRQIPRSNFSAYVYPRSEGRLQAGEVDRPYLGTSLVWTRSIRPAAGLGEIRIHDLRHTYASVAVADGASLPFIGKILGHRDTKTTSQYAHIGDLTLKRVADNAARSIEKAMRLTTAPLRE